MNINDWIEEEGINPDEVKGLNLVNQKGVNDLSGIERFVNLESLTILDGPRSKIKDFSLLYSEPLTKKLKSLTLMQIGGWEEKDFDFLLLYEKLEDLSIWNCNKIINLFSEDDLMLKKSLKTLELRLIYRLGDSVFDGFEKLRRLVIKQHRDNNLFCLDQCLLKDNLEVLELSDFEDSIDLSFLKDYQKLNELTLSEFRSFSNFSFLNSKLLKNSLRKLNITENTGLDDLSFLKGFRVLEVLDLSNSQGGFIDYSALGDKSLKKTLKVLNLDGTEGVEDLKFLRGYKQLEELYLSMYTPSSFSALEDKSLKNSLKKLSLQGWSGVESFSFLGDYKKLEVLVLEDCEGIRDFSFLNSKLLKNSLKELNLSGVNAYSDFDGIENGSLIDLSFLIGYQKLEKLHLYDCQSISDFSVLREKTLEKTMKYFDLGIIKNLQEISFLKNYERLEYLNLRHSSVRSISDLLNYKFVKNGGLKEISLPESIDWLETNEKGQYINGIVVKKLRNKGIQVNVPENFHYEEPKVELKPKLYVICGLSGSGKSTLIEYMKEELGVKQLNKTTTRGYRDNEMPGKGIISVPLSDFEEMFRKGKMEGVHEFYKNMYGISALDLMEAYLSKETYLFDTCDPKMAFDLRDAHPDFVEVVMVDPSLEIVEKGLNLRKGDKTTSERLKHIVEEKIKFTTYLLGADYILKGDYDSNVKKIKEIIQGAD